jgi:hypothetical protein
MTTVALRPLSDLAKQANRYFHLAETHGQNAVEYAIKCGDELGKIKDQLEHGQWLPWLEKHFDGSARTAQVYVQFAKANAQTSADLESISAGLKAIAKAAEPEPEPKTSSKDVRNLLQRVNDQTGEVVIDATVVEDEIDARFVKARADFQRVVDLMDEALTLNDVSATDKRREAARLAKSTANTLLAIL